jgi:membrane protein
VLRDVARDVASRMRGHDLVLYGAGLTLYGGIALLPAAVVALRFAGALLGEQWVASHGDRMGAALPGTLGAPRLVTRLVEAGAHLGPLTLLAALLASTLYGEGLRRAFVRLSETRESYVGWRGRLGVLPLLLVTPVMAAAVLALAPTLARLTSQGVGGVALAVYLALVVDWLVLAVPLTYVYRVLSPVPVSWRAAALSAFVTASFVSGFLQGFVLFLALPLDLGVPFGGFTEVGAAVAVAFWLWLLHLLVLVGYQVVLALDRRRNGSGLHRPETMEAAAAEGGVRFASSRAPDRR